MAFWTKPVKEFGKFFIGSLISPLCNEMGLLLGPSVALDISFQSPFLLVKL